MTLASFEPGGLAVVVGATGGLGGALMAALAESGAFAQIIGFSRHSSPPLDVLDEPSIEAAAASIRDDGRALRLVIVATGLLHADNFSPEKSWRALGHEALARNFAVNAGGPALVAKHFLPLLPRTGKSVFAAVSAKVGSIGDNRLGGWYAYRAAKAALNQLIRTAAIELARTRPEAICVTLHPGTVQTRLSEPFRGPGHEGDPPDFAARRLLAVIEGATPEHTGLLLDHTGESLPF